MHLVVFNRIQRIVSFQGFPNPAQRSTLCNSKFDPKPITRLPKSHPFTLGYSKFIQMLAKACPKVTPREPKGGWAQSKPCPRSHGLESPLSPAISWTHRALQASTPWWEGFRFFLVHNSLSGRLPSTLEIRLRFRIQRLSLVSDFKRRLLFFAYWSIPISWKIPTWPCWGKLTDAAWEKEADQLKNKLNDGVDNNFLR